MAVRKNATNIGTRAAYAVKREQYNRPSAKNVATHVARRTAGTAADKHPMGGSYLEPKNAKGVQVIKHGKQVKM